MGFELEKWVKMGRKIVASKFDKKANFDNWILRFVFVGDEATLTFCVEEK